MRSIDIKETNPLQNLQKSWQIKTVVAEMDQKAIPHRKLAEDFQIGADNLPITEEKCTLSDR